MLQGCHIALLGCFQVFVCSSGCHSRCICWSNCLDCGVLLLVQSCWRGGLQLQHFYHDPKYIAHLGCHSWVPPPSGNSAAALSCCSMTGSFYLCVHVNMSAYSLRQLQANMMSEELCLLMNFCLPCFNTCFCIACGFLTACQLL